MTSRASGPVRRGRWSPDDIRRGMLLYAVTDRTWLAGRTLGACVRAAIAGGVGFVQLREKGLASDAVAREARALIPICHEARIPFLINDDVEAALRANADGVHVGQSDTACARAREQLGPNAIIGVSAGSVEEALEAERAGADYLGVGAMFTTETKRDASPVALGELRRICAAVSIPVTAIGGINLRTLPCLASTGADGVAVVSGIFAAADIRGAARDLRALALRTFR